ncbi:glycosyltransferase family 4 protein [Leeia sp. IMCC25680]|uniref:Glycosyltransferase family 4 protein n=2 Tax=Leeia aquatica TaxID=2725557 RepID=A0A847RZ95_9NEIS|nr:glycosyltransferase family 4 protein [Leeia aquatica]
MTRLFIHATNVHQGGGRALLLSLIKATEGRWETIFCLDERMELPSDFPFNQVHRVKPSVVQRFRAELWLKRNVKAGDMVLCFGNLPPLFRLPCHVTVFLQNRYLVDNVDLGSFPLKTRLRLQAERLWFASKMSNVDEFIVQTPSMQRLLKARTRADVQVRPFMEQHETYRRAQLEPDASRKTAFDFLYVASGEPHKNHRTLIEAWCLLAQQGLFPSLRLTLDTSDFPQLCNWLEAKVAKHALHIETLGKLSHEKVLECYGEVGALIFPSTFESFGLPLIEARQAGLPILASELDYVRDVVDPEQTFDPLSAISIARAVKRHLQQEENPLPLLGATAFLDHVVERAGKSAHSDC